MRPLISEDSVVELFYMIYIVIVLLLNEIMTHDNKQQNTYSRPSALLRPSAYNNHLWPLDTKDKPLVHFSDRF